MSEQSNIAWTDSTWNPWIGCSKVGLGCANCYAERLGARFGVKWGGPRRRSKDATFYAPLRWQKKPWVCVCGQAFAEPEPHELGWAWCPDRMYHRRRVFLGSLMDWLDPDVPASWLAEVLDVIRQCPDLRFITVTKRPELWMKRMAEAQGVRIKGYDVTALWSWIDRWLAYDPPPNVIVLASVEDQDSADKRIPKLLKIPAMCHGLSVEPLLGPVALTRIFWPDRNGGEKYENCLADNVTAEAKARYPSMRWPQTVKWVIIGGESGPKARPCNVAWIRDIMLQCREANVPCFVKQFGAKRQWTPETMDHETLRRIQDRSGSDPSEWPEDLRVRDFPWVLR